VKWCEHTAQVSLGGVHAAGEENLDFK